MIGGDAMTLLQLRCFLAVAETLHFGRAAQRLDMLPASLGRHLKLYGTPARERLVAMLRAHVGEYAATA